MKVAYARLSRDRDGLSTSIPDQLREIRAFCAERGWTDVIEFTDNDVSASTSKPRPSWTRMLKDLESIDAIVCWNVDRLYRKPSDLEVLIEKAERGQLTVHAIHTSTLDLSTPSGRAVARTLAAWARHESELLAERVKRKLRSLEQEGKHGGGPRRYGYESDGMTIVPEEAEAIRAAATALLRGATLKSIVRDMTARGIVSAQGKPWRAANLARTLRSPRIAGIHPVTGERAAWPAILIHRDHAALSELLENNRRIAQPRGEQYLLSGGLAVCGICGGRMIGRPVSKDRRYLCDAQGSVHLSISAWRLENHVIAQGAHHEEENPPAQVAAVDPSTLAAPILAALEDADRALEDWAGQLATGLITQAEFRGARRALVARQADLERELKDVAPPVPRLWPTAEELEYYSSTHGARVWLEQIVERVEILPAERAGQFSPDRIRIVWR